MLFSTIEAGTEIQTQPTQSGGGGGNVLFERRGVKKKKKTSPPPISLLTSRKRGDHGILHLGGSCHAVGLWGDHKKKKKNKKKRPKNIVDLSLNLLVKTLKLSFKKIPNCHCIDQFLSKNISNIFCLLLNIGFLVQRCGHLMGIH